MGGKSIAGNTVASVGGGADMALGSPSKGIEFEAWQPEEDAPLMSFDESRLVMQVVCGGVGVWVCGGARVCNMFIRMCVCVYMMYSCRE